jgi:hypothetical protein
VAVPIHGRPVTPDQLLNTLAEFAHQALNQLAHDVNGRSKACAKTARFCEFCMTSILQALSL